MRGRALQLPSLTGLQIPLGAAWRWWIGELAGLIPERLRGLLFPQRPLVTVDLLDDVVVVRRRTRAREAELLRTPMEIASKLSPLQIDKLRKAVTTRDVVAIRLPRQDVLRRTLILPVAAIRNLRSILAFELERQSPLPLDQVSFDHRVLARDRKTNKLTVELQLVKREAVGRAVALSRSLGLEPSVVCSADDDTPGSGCNFLGGSKRTSRSLRRWLVGILICGIVALGLANLLVTLDNNQQVLSRLSAQLVALKAEAKTVEDLRTEIEKERSRVAFLTGQKAGMPVMELLAEITRVLPDDTWLFELQLRGSEVRIRGLSQAASNLIGLVEASPLLVNAQFGAPLTQGPRGDGERFDLVFQAEGGGP